MAGPRPCCATAAMPLSSLRREYVSCAADSSGAVPNISSLFLRPRTFSAGAPRNAGHLRLRSPRVISPLRRVIAVSPSVCWPAP